MNNLLQSNFGNQSLIIFRYEMTLMERIKILEESNNRIRYVNKHTN